MKSYHLIIKKTTHLPNVHKLKYLVTSYLLLVTFFVFSQNPVKVNEQSIHKTYLEHLVKIGVDEVRKKHGCKPLINDSLLYVASNHHATYMRNKEQISHFEEDSVLTRTPQDRGNYFGATNYRIGENVLFTSYNATVVGKKGKEFDTHYYTQLADAIVTGWVNSPGHFKNMITPDYQLTGLSVAIDTVRNRVYACQKFAVVDYQYSFEENKEMFPYSVYEAEPVTSSFKGMEDSLIDWTYDFKLRHDKPEECDKCLELEKEKPFITLRVERNQFILRVENSDYVKNLMDDRQDGFAVEIVTFDDYMCGNPAYYTKPSRRNGQIKLNGRILEPVYKKDLEKGYKKRKKRKDVKFIPYIFQSDSVAFFKRFGRYKLDKYNYQYFEIKLGRVPSDISGFWMHDLVYIQDKQICDIDYFTGYCGEVYEEYQPTAFIPASAEGDYTFVPDKKKLRFTIPFERGKSEFTEEDIAPFISSISDLSYNVDSVHIHTYSSVEGDKLTNMELQSRRANSIVGVLQKYQSTDFPVSIQMSTDWDGFYAAVKQNRKWRHLVNKTEEEISNELSKTDYEALEPLLAKERRGDIELYCTINVADKNLEYFIKKELKEINKNLDSLLEKSKRDDHELQRFENLYTFVHHAVVYEKVDAALLAAIEMPNRFREDHELLQKFILYGYEFEEAFKNNKQWVEEHEECEQYLVETCENHILPEFVYILAKNAEKMCRERGNEVEKEDIQAILSNLTHLDRFYTSDSTAERNIDNLNFNLNVTLLNYVFATDPLKHSEDAIKSIAQLNEFYLKYGEMNGQRAIGLAKTAVHFQEINRAMGILTPYATEDSVLAYMMPMRYIHPFDEGSDEYYAELIELASQMDDKLWCNMFMSECQIPFQAFDHERLRDVFCKQCLDKNDQIQILLGKKEAEVIE